LVEFAIAVAVVMTLVLKNGTMRLFDELTSVACPRNGSGDVTEAVDFIIEGGLSAEPMAE
jgi:hypothetical protein